MVAVFPPVGGLDVGDGGVGGGGGGGGKGVGGNTEYWRLRWIMELLGSWAGCSIATAELWRVEVKIFFSTQISFSSC
jgi:hypothetical protein